MQHTPGDPTWKTTAVISCRPPPIARRRGIRHQQGLGSRLRGCGEKTPCDDKQAFLIRRQRGATKGRSFAANVRSPAPTCRPSAGRVSLYVRESVAKGAKRANLRAHTPWSPLRTANGPSGCHTSLFRYAGVERKADWYVISSAHHEHAALHVVQTCLRLWGMRATSSPYIYLFLCDSRRWKDDCFRLRGWGRKTLYNLAWQ